MKGITVLNHFMIFMWHFLSYHWKELVDFSIWLQPGSVFLAPFPIPHSLIKYLTPNWTNVGLCYDLVVISGVFIAVMQQNTVMDFRLQPWQASGIPYFIFTYPAVGVLPEKEEVQTLFQDSFHVLSWPLWGTFLWAEAKCYLDKRRQARDSLWASTT